MPKRTMKAGKRSSRKMGGKKGKKGSRKTNRKRGGGMFGNVLSVLPGMRKAIAWEKPFSTRRKVTPMGAFEVYNMTWEPTTPGIATNGTLTLDFASLGIVSVFIDIPNTVLVDLNALELTKTEDGVMKKVDFGSAGLPTDKATLRKCKLIFIILNGGISAVTLNNNCNIIEIYKSDVANGIAWNKLQTKYESLFKSRLLANIIYGDSDAAVPTAVTTDNVIPVVEENTDLNV